MGSRFLKFDNAHLDLLRVGAVRKDAFTAVFSNRIVQAFVVVTVDGIEYVEDYGRDVAARNQRFDHVLRTWQIAHKNNRR